VSKYRNYLYDLGFLIKERALNAKKAPEQEKKGSEGYMYESGRLLAFNEVVSIMQQQAVAFGIPLGELRLEEIDPDRDLI
jgi:hypothetical protein